MGEKELNKFREINKIAIINPHLLKITTNPFIIEEFDKYLILLINSIYEKRFKIKFINCFLLFQ